MPSATCASPPERFQTLGRGFRGCKLLENRREKQQVHLFCPGKVDIVQAVAGQADDGIAAGSAEDLPHAPGRTRLRFTGKMHSVGAGGHGQSS